jgi:hypothetical protein
MNLITKWLHKKHLKEEVISHYDRMIAWVKKQNPNEYVRPANMYFKLGENWSADSCPLCNYYELKCHKCPIGRHTKQYSCQGTPFVNICLTINWEEWLVAAGKELEFLKSLDF